MSGGTSRMNTKTDTEIAGAPRALLAELRRRAPRLTRTLSRFVRAESPSTDKPALDRLARIVAAEWRGGGGRGGGFL
jgi:hypothetical protein